MSDIVLLLISMEPHDDADDIHTPQLSSPLPESNEKAANQEIRFVCSQCWAAVLRSWTTSLLHQ